MQLLVHGGAGSESADPAAQQVGLDRAVAAGAQASEPLLAVRAAVRVLEAEPVFNAGTGSAVQSDGRIRTDAGVMTATEAGPGLVGAVAGLPDVEHAVDVATLVAKETPHVLVGGERAVTLAAESGIATDCDLWTADTRERWAEADPPEPVGSAAHRSWVRAQFGGTDTVGAVATDGDELAAGTSTGGRWFAHAGRIGDVPQVGAGFYASSAAAASATGEGEAIARYGLARQVVAAVEDGDDPQTAADRVIRGFETETGGTAGVIVVDDTGTRGRAHNATAMQTAVGGDADGES